MDFSQISALYDQPQKQIGLFSIRREENLHIVWHISNNKKERHVLTNLNSAIVKKVIPKLIYYYKKKAHDFKWMYSQHETQDNLKECLPALNFKSQDPEVAKILNFKNILFFWFGKGGCDIQCIDNLDKMDDVINIAIIR